MYYLRYLPMAVELKEFIEYKMAPDTLLEEDENVMEVRYTEGSKIGRILAENGLHNLTLAATKTHDMCAGGTRSRSIICIDSIALRVAPAAFSFLFKHEIAHIKARDDLIGAALRPTISLAIAAFWRKNSTSLWNTFLVYCAAAIGQELASRVFTFFAEYRADNYAIKQATDEELIGAFCYFIGKIEAGKALNKKGVQEFSEDGEYLKDYDHPSLTSRVDKIAAECKKRAIVVKDTPLTALQIDIFTAIDIGYASGMTDSSQKRLRELMLRLPYSARDIYQEYLGGFSENLMQFVKKAANS